METFGNKNEQNESTYSCTVCDYNTMRKTNLERHFKSVKHKKKFLETFGNNSITTKIRKIYTISNEKCTHINCDSEKAKTKNEQNEQKNEQDDESCEFICAVCIIPPS